MAPILHNELYTRVWVFPLRARPGWLIVSSWPILKYATWPSGLLRFRVHERNKTECSRSFCPAFNRRTLEPRQSAVDFVQPLSSVSSSLFPSSSNDSVHRCSFVSCPTRTRRRRSCIREIDIWEAIVRRQRFFCRRLYYLSQLQNDEDQIRRSKIK